MPLIFPFDPVLRAILRCCLPELPEQRMFSVEYIRSTNYGRMFRDVGLLFHNEARKDDYAVLQFQLMEKHSVLLMRHLDRLQQLVLRYDHWQDLYSDISFDTFRVYFDSTALNLDTILSNVYYAAQQLKADQLRHSAAAKPFYLSSRQRLDLQRHPSSSKLPSPVDHPPIMHVDPSSPAVGYDRGVIKRSSSPRPVQPQWLSHWRKKDQMVITEGLRESLLPGQDSSDMTVDDFAAPAPQRSESAPEKLLNPSASEAQAAQPRQYRTPESDWLELKVSDINRMDEEISRQMKYSLMADGNYSYELWDRLTPTVYDIVDNDQQFNAFRAALEQMAKEDQDKNHNRKASVEEAEAQWQRWGRLRRTVSYIFDVLRWLLWPPRCPSAVEQVGVGECSLPRDFQWRDRGLWWYHVLEAVLVPSLLIVVRPRDLLEGTLNEFFDTVAIVVILAFLLVGLVRLRKQQEKNMEGLTMMRRKHFLSKCMYLALLIRVQMIIDALLTPPLPPRQAEPFKGKEELEEKVVLQRSLSDQQTNRLQSFDEQHSTYPLGRLPRQSSVEAVPPHHHHSPPHFQTLSSRRSPPSRMTSQPLADPRPLTLTPVTIPTGERKSSTEAQLRGSQSAVPVPPLSQLFESFPASLSSSPPFRPLITSAPPTTPAATPRSQTPTN